MKEKNIKISEGKVADSRNLTHVNISDPTILELVTLTNQFVKGKPTSKF